jgi:hypothetical protein
VQPIDQQQGDGVLPGDLRGGGVDYLDDVAHADAGQVGLQLPQGGGTVT